MLFENKKTHLFISAVLVTSLIFTSVFVSLGINEVSAEVNEVTTAEDLAQIEELTVAPEQNAEYDGYIVKVEDGRESKVDEDAVTDYASTDDNEYVVVDEPSDTLDFVEPEYVEYIEPNYMRYPVANNGTDGGRYIKSTAKGSAGIQPFLTSVNAAAYDRINVESAWAKGYDGVRIDGTSVNVAILDTGLNNHIGIDSNHVKGRYNFVGSYPYGYGGSPNVSDSYNPNDGHGTFVTGLIASQPLANSTYSFQGIAPESNLYIGKIMTAAGGSVGDFIIALETLASVDKIDVLNMSLGGEGFSNAEYSALSKLTNKGTIAVAAAGNEGTEGSPLNYPANYPNVIGVGSVNSDGNVSYFSTRNSSVLITAPGNSINSISSGDSQSLHNMSGTSFSAPMVTGAIAMLREIKSGITRNQVLTLIRQTSNSSSKSNKNSYDISLGYGILDVAEMTDRATGSIASSYKITYRVEGASLTGTVPTIYESGKVTGLPRTVTKQGYKFSHWVDQRGIKRLSTPTSGDLILSPVLIPNNYKLFFKGNGGKVRTASKTVTYAKPIGSLNTPKKRKGRNFLGWFTKKKGGSQYYKGRKYAKIGNLTLYAHWTKKNIVKFNANKGIVSKYAKAITKGKKIGTLPKPSRSGYTFKGWYTKKKGGTKVTKSKRVTRSGNMTLYAHWKKR